jgi:ABC-type lipoprotein export system ATPase subunit/bifunctional DNA-binding transcriptional regulator/antitoxin component of YhaV-PrlF toxin-antitoxin module
MSNTDPFIVCENLVKIYKIADLEVVALQGLDLSVSRGELLGIVGASGSGKSTLMNILGGLDRPSAGRVWINGMDLIKLSDSDLIRYRRTKVGFVWQQGARNLIPYLSAVENVRLPLMISGKDFGRERARAEELLEIVGLSERKNHRLVEMSGGEQQRVAIAVALANNPTLLLADEPTGEVDSNTAAGIFKAFQDLTHNLGVTTLIVSHDLGIARYTDRVVAIRDGKTSSETVRQSLGNQDGNSTDLNGEVQEDVFEEVVLLDTAGRLQLPREYLEELEIKGRVQLELVEGGIIVRPAKNNLQDQPASNQQNQVESIAEKKGIRGWFSRIRHHESKAQNN